MPAESGGQINPEPFFFKLGFARRRLQVALRAVGDPVLYLSNPDGIDAGLRREMLDDVAALNRVNLERYRDPEIATRINSFEMAYRMQTSVPELVEPHKRARAFGIFYTGTIGSGAVSPALFGLVGDALGVPTALMVVACVCLLTLPLALMLRPALPSAAR